MSSKVDEVLVADIARILIAKIAPAELPIFRSLSAAYFADPVRSLEGDAGGDGPLRMGDTGIVQMLTPVAHRIAGDIVTYLLAEAILRPTLSYGSAAVRRLFGAKGDSTDEVPLKVSGKQLAELHQVVTDAVRRYGLTPDVARTITDAVIVDTEQGQLPEPEGAS